MIPSPEAKAIAIHSLRNRMWFSVPNLCAWHSLQLRLLIKIQAQNHPVFIGSAYLAKTCLLALKHHFCEVHHIKEENKTFFRDACKSAGSRGVEVGPVQ